jgi:branched-chain amino acid aminotransferase
VREEPLPMSVLDDASEVFITSSTKDVLAVHAIDNRALTAPGPATAHVAAIFAHRSRENPNP